MTPGIKKCPTCSASYTGDTGQCWSCLLKASPLPEPPPPLSRAERRAARRAEQRAQANAQPRNRERHAPGQAPRDHHRREGRQARSDRVPPTPVPPLSPPPPPLSPAQLQLRWPPPPLQLNRPAPRRVSEPDPLQHQKGQVQSTGCEPLPASKPGLGALARSVGAVRAELDASGRVVKKATRACSCQGMNPTCFKCDGTGYCEVELDHGPAEQGPIDQIRARQNQAPEPEVGFSGDPRGGEPYGIRERGRYGSNPLHDDHDS